MLGLNELSPLLLAFEGIGDALATLRGDAFDTLISWCSSIFCILFEDAIVVGTG